MTATGKANRDTSSFRAEEAAVLSTLALFDLEAGTKLSGDKSGLPEPPGSDESRLQSGIRIAGEKYNNVEQNADRCLPSGGDTGSRNTR